MFTARVTRHRAIVRGSRVANISAVIGRGQCLCNRLQVTIGQQPLHLPAIRADARGVGGDHL